MGSRLQQVKDKWVDSSVGQESTLHQLAPYIGKLKSSVARTLIEEYTKPRQIVLDPFCGSGVVPLEALILGRGAFASDISPYAAVLTKAKMRPPSNCKKVNSRAEYFVETAKATAKSCRYIVDAPSWVRSFFHPRTLAETKILADLLIQNRQWFILASLLGILHHQRPGFLSYPASHLVPYLRTKKFPNKEFPSLYEYRDVKPRLLKKITRAYRRFGGFEKSVLKGFRQENIKSLRFERKADIAITSPPYMNALAYGRDNRLRLWFLGVEDYKKFDSLLARTQDSFRDLMVSCATTLHRLLKPKARAILVVGDVERNGKIYRTHDAVRVAFEECVGGWVLMDVVVDAVPDIRRSRRNGRCTKREWVMDFEKT